MSGGVDSSVCAYLLKSRGYEVIGATIKTWSSNECRDEKSKGCCSLRDVDDARSVARALDIPFYVLDLSQDFKEKVMDYFVDEYLKGRTPNPCIECNNHIKFGLLDQKARELGAQGLATGHYARKMREAETGRYCIAEGLDASKDQSYVLFGLTQEQLSRVELPIGELKKSEVRQMAEAIGLRVHDKPDSQEICFVKGRYGDYLKEAASGRLPGQGAIVDRQGVVYGTHDGSYLFTVGQKKRLRLDTAPSYFVTGLKPELNQVVVGPEEDLFDRRMEVGKLNWQLAPRTGKIFVKIRSRHEKVSAEILQLSDGRAIVEFDEPQKSVTPGQAAVFYDGIRVLGGGWIHSAA